MSDIYEKAHSIATEHHDAVQEMMGSVQALLDRLGTLEAEAVANSASAARFEEYSNFYSSITELVKAKTAEINNRLSPAHETPVPVDGQNPAAPVEG